jgi:choline-sulfatase
VAEITNQMEYDDDVAHLARQRIYDLARGGDRPWCLTVSFTHPHDPYVARKEYWDLYEDCKHLQPMVPALAYSEQDPHSQRLMDANDYQNFNITADDIARSRRAYFANLSYLDDHIGRILKTLRDTRQEAIVLFVSDHGDMLGEGGMWFKMSFREGSARVPLMISAPGLDPHKIDTPVSTIDVLPTLCDLAGIDMDEVMPWTDGTSLLPLAQWGERTAPVAMEYAAEGSQAPLVGLRYGKWKYIRCALDPDQLFDLDADPLERTNLADHPGHQGTVASLRAKSEARWNLAAFDAAVRKSQARRWVVYPALRNGDYYPWDYQPLQKASERYMRNHMDLNTLEESKRFPRGE